MILIDIIFPLIKINIKNTSIDRFEQNHLSLHAYIVCIILEVVFTSYKITMTENTPVITMKI